MTLPMSVFPASFAQSRLWFLDQFEPNSHIYNLDHTFHLRGALDMSALERATNELVRRHETLRTTFSAPQGEPMQCIAPALPLEVTLIDLREIPPAQREAAGAAHLLELRQRPFDLAHGPLFRPCLLRLADDEYVLTFCMHHIICDEWSMQILSRELSALYSAYRDGQPSPLTDLPIQYADVSVWQRQWLRGEALQKQLEYWQEQLSGAPATLDLLTDHPRPAVQTHRGAAEMRQMAAGLLTSLSSLARTERATPFMAALAAYALLLHRYAGQSDIVIGTPIANRRRVELEGLIGFFVNTLVLRVDLSGNPTFRELLRRVRELALDAYDHQDLPFEKLVEELGPERNLSHSPLFQVMFSLQTVPQAPLQLEGLEVSPMPTEDPVARFDLSLNVTPGADNVRARLVYNTALFERASIERLLGHYETLMEAIVARPDERIGRLPLLTPAERQLQLVGWNQTRRPYDVSPVHVRFAAQALRTPEAAAIVADSHSGLGGANSKTLSYRELNAQANRLGHYLMRHGVAPETPVGICLEPSTELIAAVLGVLKAGAAYLPLDPHDPEERLRFLLHDSGATCVLTTAALRERLGATPAKLLCIDVAADQIAAESQDDPPPMANPDNLAYVLYTSGSTGWPKGVMVEHGSLSNYLSWVTHDLLAGDGPLLPFTTRLSFDACLKQMLAPLLVGGSVWLLPPDVVAQPSSLLGELKARPHCGLNCVPSLWQAMVETMDADPDLRPGPNFARLLLGGEAIPPGLVERTLALLPHVQVWNLYGPTEATANAAAGPLTSDEHVTIGQPVANVRLYVLDPYEEPTPIGVAGELYIGGVGVARGYWNRPDLTAAAFIPDPFSTTAGARLYRTGDRARYLRDGRIEFLGRLDSQVKVRGYRIELGEVENVLRRHPAVLDAAVLAYDAPRAVDSAEAGHTATALAAPGGGKRLVAYLVPRGRPAPPAQELIAFLQRNLPAYMVPAHLIWLDSMPLTSSGKVNRRALPRPERVDVANAETFVAPRTPLEELVAGIWAELLGLPRVGVLDNFFQLGGHSLLAMQVVARLQSTLGIALPVRALFESPSVAGLALLVLERLAGPEDSAFCGSSAIILE